MMTFEKEKQSGSSMVEMLGYLAIFVLLAGMVYIGYAAANRRIKIDRTVNAVNDVIQDVRTGFGAKRFYSVLGGGADFVDSLIQNDIVSAKLCINLNCTDKTKKSSCTCSDKADGVSVLTHPLGGRMKIILVDPVPGLTNSYRQFAVELLDIDEKTCFPLVSQNWNGSGETVNVIESLAIDDNPKYTDAGGNEKSGFTKFPVNLGDAKTLCGKNESAGNHKLTFTVR